MKEYVIQNEPEFDDMCRRMVREYEARRRRRDDDSGASAGVVAPVDPPPPTREMRRAKLLPELDDPAV